MNKHLIILVLITIFAGILRFHGLNWDQGHHLHPDERFLTLVTTSISWPSSLSQFLDTSTSPANPHNRGYDFYVYGTFPIFLVKFIAGLFHRDNYVDLVIVGRLISAIFDLGTCLLVYLSTLNIVKHRSTALMATFIYSISVLPIQLSHYFTVDTFLVFFLSLSFYILLLLIGTHSSSKSVLLSLSLGIAFGLALASKISAILFFPLIGLGLIFKLAYTKKITPILLAGILFLITGYFSLRFSQPYLFADSSLLSLHLNPKVVANWSQLKSFDDPAGWFPPAVQWINAPSLTYPFLNLLFWGLGLPLGIISLISLILTPFQIARFRQVGLLLALLWIIGLFIYQGFQFAKPMRYFLSLFPFLAITTSIFVVTYFKKYLLPFILLIIIYPLSFMAIYSSAHTRVTATSWIYSHIPVGSTISCDYWDDCLPLGDASSYRQISLHLYDPDTPEKWTILNQQLQQLDYIFISSNRLYGSITASPEKYPLTARFYSDLFSGKLGFTQIAEFASRPSLPIPGISWCLVPPLFTYGQISPLTTCPPGLHFIDDYADESFTVYDHPKVTIFQKN